MSQDPMHREKDLPLLALQLDSSARPQPQTHLHGLHTAECTPNLVERVAQSS